MTPAGAETNTRSYRVGAVLTLAFAALSLTLGVPRLIESLHALAAQDTVTALNAGETPSPASLVEASSRLAAAARWSAGGEQKLDQGLVLLRQAMTTSDQRAQTELFAAAEKSTSEGLAVGPGEAGAWARLAWLRLQLGNRDGAMAALRLSFLSGAFVPVLMPSRLELALVLLPAMNEEMQSLLRRQIRLIWVLDPKAVATLAERPGLGALVRSALAELSEEEVSQHVGLHGPRR